ncbi:hypothetical protein HCU40_09865 [Pseudanabaena biceps]|nr:hypothetical protein [Pseudanabaena biceps]
MKLKSRLRFYTSVFLTSALIIGGSFSLSKLALASGTSAGTVITNTATGSFDGETSGTSGTVTSNAVTLSVLEVTGITVATSGVTKATPTQVTTDGLTGGPYQSTATETVRGDIVYFDFTITNTGNSPTAFFIPDVTTITNGTQRGIRVIEVDPDGSVVTNAPTVLNTTVPSGGGITTAFLGTTDGYIPVNGTVKVRVAVEITGTQVGNTTTVVLGNTSVANGQNEDYVASTGPANRDVFTSDLANGTVVPTTGYAAGVPTNTGYAGKAGIDQTVETNGAPVNGDTTFSRKEASNTQTVNITSGIDYGDAPNTFGTVLNSATGYSGSGASHLIDNTIKIGTAVTDAEDDGQPTVGANGDDSNGTTPDDEDGVTLPNFDINQTTYTATVNVTNTTGSSAYLVGWIDFNRDGVFQTSEAVIYDATPGGNIDPIPTGTTNSPLTLTWTLPAGLSAGDRYARFRLTTDLNVIGNVITPVAQALTPLGKGEVEDYILGKVPGFNLVKRITNINGTDITGFVNGPDVIGNNDSDVKWPSPNTQYLRGGVNCTPTTPCTTSSGTISGAKPGDLVEYTIYFLSNGSDNVKNVQLCDRIPSSGTAPIYNTTFEPDTYGTGNGVLFGWDSQATPTTLPDPTNSTLVPSIKVAIANTVAFVASSTALPTTPCNGTANPNGAVLFNIGASTVVPAATGAGAPINSYGFIRFKVKVN